MKFYQFYMHVKLFDIWNIAWIFIFITSCCSSCSVDVNSYAKECFSTYNVQLSHIRKTDRTFFSGVDVENIRLLCSQEEERCMAVGYLGIISYGDNYYKTGIHCIRNLHSECPQKQGQIDVALISIHGEQTDPLQLCKEDKMFDVYARNHNCFILHGKYSESCFENAMDLPISSLHEIVNKPLTRFCSELKSLNSCISTNIRLRCGTEAESLVDTLIRSSIKRSQECENLVPSSQTSTSGSSVKNGHNSNSGKTLWNNSIYRTLLISLIFLILKHSIRL